jgi:hypothetical protein
VAEALEGAASIERVGAIDTATRAGALGEGLAMECGHDTRGRRANARSW